MEKRSLILLLLVCGICSITIAQVTLPAGTKVYLNLTAGANSTSHTVGQLVNLKVYNDVVINGQVVITAGTSGIGEIVDCKKATGKGMPGKISIVAKSIQHPNGSEILLKGTTYESIGEDQKNEACFVGAFGCVSIPIVGLLAYFFVKGKPAYLNTATLLEGEVITNYTL